MIHWQWRSSNRYTCRRRSRYTARILDTLRGLPSIASCMSRKESKHIYRKGMCCCCCRVHARRGVARRGSFWACRNLVSIRSGMLAKATSAALGSYFLSLQSKLIQHREQRLLKPTFCITLVHITTLDRSCISCMQNRLACVASRRKHLLLIFYFLVFFLRNVKQSNMGNSEKSREKHCELHKRKE